MSFDPLTAAIILLIILLIGILSLFNDDD